MLEKVFMAFPLILIIEGAAILLLTDKTLEKVRLALAMLTARQLRFIGLSLMIIGVVTLWLVSVLL